MFKHAENATHDDILFAPHKTPEIEVPEVRMQRDGQVSVLIQNYEPAEYMESLLK
jgi:aminopeptidase